MNPEDNQDNNTPDLDQVAADLTAAISDGTIDSPAPETPAEPTSETSTEPTPETLTEPVPETPTVEPTAEVSAGPSIESPAEPTPETITTPESPIAEVPVVEPVAETSAAQSAPEALAVEPETSAVEPTFETPQEPTTVVPIDTPTIEAPADLTTASINGPVAAGPSTELQAPEVAASQETPAEAPTVAPEPLATTPETPTEPSLENPTEPTLEPQTSSESPEATSTSFVDQPASSEENSEKTEDQDDDDEEDQLKPADPVPGSIGSAINYSETAPDHSEPVVKKKKPINKANLRLIIIIVAAVALIAIVVVILLFIFSSGSNKATTTKAAATNTPTVTMSSLTCTLSTDDAQTLISYGNATSAEEKYLATFSDDELYDIAKTATIEYEDEATVRHSQTNVKNIYESKFKNVGLTSDPFESTYSISNSTLSIQHYAVAEDIDATTATILDIPVVNGEPDTSLDSLKQAYKGKKYTCSSKVDK